MVPLGAEEIGVPAVVTLIAAVAALLIVHTLCWPVGFRLRLKARDAR